MLNRSVWLILLGSIATQQCFLWDRFERPENVKLLLSREGHYLFNPVYAQHGSKVYYLGRAGLLKTYESPIGSLWVFNISDSSSTFLLDGKFCALAISNDGTKLALAGGPLVVSDTLGKVVNTIPVPKEKTIDVEFSRDGSKLYFYAEDGDSGEGYYSVNSDGTEYKFLFLRRVAFRDPWFDLLPNDSIITADRVPLLPSHFQINNQNPNIVVASCSSGEPLISYKDLYFVDLSVYKIIDTLRAMPYKHSFCDYPYWSPSGKDVVYSVEIWDDKSDGHLGELWVIENVR